MARRKYEEKAPSADEVNSAPASNEEGMEAAMPEEQPVVETQAPENVEGSVSSEAENPSSPVPSKLIDVRSCKPSFWRCGMNFGHKPIRLEVEKLESGVLTRLQAEPNLEVTFV